MVLFTGKRAKLYYPIERSFVDLGEFKIRQVLCCKFMHKKQIFPFSSRLSM